MRLLVIEDSVSLCTSLRAGLRKLGHAVDVVSDGKVGLSYARLNPYDVVILDLMLPGLDGMQVLRSIRALGNPVPILVLTARDALEDRVAGIRQGADDYLVKPFAFDELVARIEALARRSHGAPSPVVTIGDLVIDTAARTVARAGHAIQLQRREYALLLYLAERRGKVVTRIEIEDHLYDEGRLPNSNVVSSALSALRRQLAIPGRTDLPDLIDTRRGLGYVLDEPRA